MVNVGKPANSAAVVLASHSNEHASSSTQATNSDKYSSDSHEKSLQSFTDDFSSAFPVMKQTCHKDLPSVNPKLHDITANLCGAKF